METAKPLPPQETATRSYLHLLAYGLPSALFVIFASVVLVPRLETIWSEVNQRAEAEWILVLCQAFTLNFYFIAGALVLFFVIIERVWAGWSRVRRRVVRCITWLATMLVMAGMTWMAVTALLVVPMAIVKAKKEAKQAVSEPQ